MLGSSTQSVCPALWFPQLLAKCRREGCSGAGFLQSLMLFPQGQSGLQPVFSSPPGGACLSGGWDGALCPWSPYIIFWYWNNKPFSQREVTSLGWSWWTQLPPWSIMTFHFKALVDICGEGPQCKYLRAKSFRGINDHKGKYNSLQCMTPVSAGVGLLLFVKTEKAACFLYIFMKRMGPHIQPREQHSCLLKYPGVIEGNLMWPTYNALKSGPLRLGVRASLPQHLGRLSKRQATSRKPMLTIP